jgi:hypothetical protein
LYLLIAVTVAAYLISRFDRRRHGRVLQRVAAELDMNYSAADPFGLAIRIADRFPVPGAARLTISDLVYGIQGGRYRYIFTAHYTVGAVRMKKRASRVVMYSEPANQAPRGTTEGDIRTASLALSWADQYRALGRTNADIETNLHAAANATPDLPL